MKTIYFVLVFSFLYKTTLADSIIAGKVIDKDGNPLLGVNIYLKDSYDGASSDINGAFEFQTDLTGKQILIASFIGYKSFQKEFSVDEDFYMEIILAEEINKIDGITISAGAFEASDKKKSVVLKTLDIVSTAGATADITGVMNTLPGTQTVGEEGKLFVRGGAGYEAKTFINGLLVAEPYGLTPQNVPSRFRFSPFLFKGAFFSTGGYSAEYGQALSSVLQLNTYDLPKASQTDISIMSVGADISQTIRKENTSLYGQVQYTDLTGYFALVPQKYGWEKAPRSINTTFHFKQNFGEVGNVQAYTNYDRSSLKVEQPTPGNINNLSMYDINTQNLYSNISLSNSIGESSSYRGGLSYTYNTNDIIMDDLKVETLTKTTHAKLVIDNDLGEYVLLKYGTEWMMNDYQELVTNPEGGIVQDLGFQNHLLSPFAEADVYFSNKFMARIGARFEYNSLLKNERITSRASLAYKIHNNSQFSLAYGKFSQMPVTEYLKYTSKLNQEEASHYILNYQYSKEGQVFRSEVYYKKYDKLATKQEAETGMTIDNSGFGDAKGFELFWRDSKTLNNVDYWVSYSYLDTKRKYDYFPYQVMPYYASQHNLSIVYKHFIGSIKSQIGWSYSFASGRPYTDPNTGEFNSRMTRNYNDLSINWSYLVKSNIIIHASISNVLGFKNIYGYQYNNQPNKQGFYDSIPVEPDAKRFLFLGCFFTISKDKNSNMLNNL